MRQIEYECASAKEEGNGRGGDILKGQQQLNNHQNIIVYSDFESNTNYNYSESAYPSQSIGGFNHQGQTIQMMGASNFHPFHPQGAFNQTNSSAGMSAALNP
jgi:hypothetical protein